MSFKDVLLNFRAKHNMNQTETAQLLGVSLASVSKYETERATPSQKNEILFKNKMKEFEEKKGE